MGMTFEQAVYLFAQRYREQQFGIASGADRRNDSAYDEWLEENMDKFSDDKDEIAFANTKDENGKRIREAKEVSEVEKAWSEYSSRNDGGPGSGNWGHEGREGEVGGSAPSDSQEASETAKSISQLKDRLKSEADKYERENAYEKLLDKAPKGEPFYMVYDDGSIEEFKKDKRGDWKSTAIYDADFDDDKDEKVESANAWHIASSLAENRTEFAETAADAKRLLKKKRAENLNGSVQAEDSDIDRLNGIGEKLSASEYRTGRPYSERKEVKDGLKGELTEALDSMESGTVLYVSNESRNGLGYFTYAIQKGENGKWSYVNPKTGKKEDDIGSAKDVAEQYIEYNEDIGFSKDYESVKGCKKSIDKRREKLESSPVDTSDIGASKEVHAEKPGRITYQSEDFGKPGKYVIYRQGNLGNGSMMFFAPKKEGADVYGGARELGDNGPTGEYEVEIKNPLIITGNGDVECINKAYNALHPDKPKRIENANQWMKADAANASALAKAGYDSILYVINGKPSEVQIPKKRIKEVKKTGSYTTTAWSQLGLTFEEAKRKGYYEKDPHDYERVDGRFDADDDTFDPDDMYYFLKDKQLQENVNKDGGPGSGNFGHEGRPGEVGGSAPAEYAGLSEEGRDIIKEHIRNPYHFGSSDEQKSANRQKLIRALSDIGVKVDYDKEEDTYSMISTNMSYEENRAIGAALNQGRFYRTVDREEYCRKCKEDGKVPRLHETPDTFPDSWLISKSGKTMTDGTPVYKALSKEGVLSDKELVDFSGLDREVSPEGAEKARKATAEAIDKMSNAERNALHNYTKQWSGENYQAVNGYLVTGEGDERAKKAAENVTSALDHPIGVDCITMRGDNGVYGTGKDEAITKLVNKVAKGDFSAAKKLQDMLTGQTITNKAAMSTSPNDTTSGYGQRPVQYVFKTPKDAKAVDISQLSSFGGGRSEVEKKLAATGLFGAVEHESEVLFKPGTRYKIDEVKFSAEFDRKGKRTGQVFIIASILTGNEDSRTDDKEPKDWITINGTHVPIDESGEITGQVAEKIKGTSTNKTEPKNNPLNDLHPDVEYPERVEYWKEQIKKGNHRPILVAENDHSRIIDGNHTLAAYKELGIEPEVYEMNRVEFLNGAGEAEDTVEFIKSAISEGKAKKIGGGQVKKEPASIGKEMSPASKNYEFADGDYEDDWIQKNAKKLMPLYKQGGSDAIDSEYRKFRMARATEDIHEISKDAADAVVADHVSQSAYDGWFRNADSGYKPKLVDYMLSNKEMRNAGLSLAYENYKNCTESPLSFDEFLTTPIKMYRGGHGQKHTKDDVFSAYTFDRKTAEHFAGSHGKITEAKIRPIDTYGSMRAVGNEAEIWVPSEIAPNGNRDSREDSRQHPMPFAELRFKIENFMRGLKKPLDFRSRSAIVKSKENTDENPYRDENGRFTSAQNDNLTNKADKKKERYERRKSGGEANSFRNQPVGAIRSGIKSLEKQVDLHEEILKNPASYDADWEKKPEKEKEGLIRHWNKEIRNFKESIERRKEELKKRGEQEK